MRNLFLNVLGYDWLEYLQPILRRAASDVFVSVINKACGDTTGVSPGNLFPESAGTVATDPAPGSGPAAKARRETESLDASVS
jgi:hypothetical protein